MTIKARMPNGGYGWYVKKRIPVKAIQLGAAFEVETKEGTMQGKAGDYLVEGVEKELYPVDREIFEKTYERVEK